MKLILRADIDNLGQLGEVVTVKPGYGRNFLLPKGLAMLATDSNLKVFEQERKKLQAKIDAAKAAAQDLADKAAAAEVVIEVRVGENDRLYGSVTTVEIAKAVADAISVDEEIIDRRKIYLDEPIRALGIYKAPFRPYPEVQVDITVKVIRHGGTVEEVERMMAQQQEAEAVEEAAEALAEMGGEAPEAAEDAGLTAVDAPEATAPEGSELETPDEATPQA